MTAVQYGVRPPHFRLPGGMTLGMVRLQVSDLERSIAWYREVLGLRAANLGPGVAIMAPESGPALLELHERAGATPAPRQGRLGLYHFAILLPDRAALGRFVAHLAQTGVRAGASDHLVSEAIYLHDPDRLGIEVYADRPRESWRVEGNELAMATLPLDLDSVVAAAQGELWTGMPAGTVLGHMHLHVGDLEKAEAFYHRALGLDLMTRSYPGALFLSAGGYHHHLGLNTWAGPSAQPAGANEARLLEWEIIVPNAADVVAAAGSMKANGWAVDETSGAAALADPWGNAVRIRIAP